EVDDSGLQVRLDIYDREQVDEARARFETLRARSRDVAARKDPPHVPANAATRASDRWHQAFEQRDWGGVAGMVAELLHFDHRRRAAQLVGDREMFLRSSRVIGSRPSTRVRETVLATAGDLLMLHRVRIWDAGGDGPGFEAE